MILKIAIGRTNGKVSDSHFGDSDELLFYSVNLETGEVEFERSVENPIKKLDEQGHGSEEKLRAAAEVLEDRSVIISGKPSPNFKKLKEKYGKIPVVVRSTDDIDEVISKIIAHFRDASLDNVEFDHGFYILL